MHFEFEANQDHQLNAIASVVDLFRGHPRLNDTFTLEQVGAKANPPVDWSLVKRNLVEIQERNGLAQDRDLAWLEGEVEGVEGGARFPNFSVEMETGTGKTYVYLRTALELNRRFGLRKFIVVVPSVAVREGVLKTLRTTQAHFRRLFDNPVYSFFTYDSGQLSRIKGFAESSWVEIMVMTIQSIRGDRVVLRQIRDQLHGQRALDMIQAVHPVLILDEPQNLETADSIQALCDLNPLCGLRYSATHRSTYNLVYRLTPLDAYRHGLVKKIQVAGLVDRDQNRPFVCLEGVGRSGASLIARLKLDVVRKSGVTTRTVVGARPGQDIAARARNPVYKGLVVEEIGSDWVRFSNRLELRTGQSSGPNKEAIFRAQIRYTIESHIECQRRLDQYIQDRGKDPRGNGIKVLSLFFVDQVSSYVGSGVEEGLVHRIFREEFDRLKGQVPEWRDKDADSVQAAYFANRDKRDGSRTYYDEDTTEDARKAFERAYALIMHSKEQLLSFDEPVAFIFSHSALREGWDNPNVFQICTLNQAVSSMRRRQEIGRGIRLCVDTQGRRVFDRWPNILTVVANESYEDYAAGLQREYAEEGLEGRAPEKAPTDPKERPRGTYRRSKRLEDPVFVQLWDRIKYQTRYRLTVDSARLIKDVVDSLDQEKVALPSIEVTKADLEFDGERLRPLISARKAYAEVAEAPMPNFFEFVEQLMEQATPPLRVTRKTILEILKRTRQQDALRANPLGFAMALVQLLKIHLLHQVVRGIAYERTGSWYEATQIFKEEFMTYLDRLKDVTENGKPLKKSMYDAVECDSGEERGFVDAFEDDPEVDLYVKLPDGFKVPTPLGTHNPDWAVVVGERDAHGNPTDRRVYLVQETKWTTHVEELRPEEQGKVLSGRAHFAALEVPYRVGPRWEGSGQ